MGDSDTWSAYRLRQLLGAAMIAVAITAEANAAGQIWLERVIGDEPIELTYTSVPSNGLPDVVRDKPPRFGPVIVPGSTLTVVSIQGGQSRSKPAQLKLWCIESACVPKQQALNAGDVVRFNHAGFLQGQVESGSSATVTLVPPQDDDSVAIEYGRVKSSEGFATAVDEWTNVFVYALNWSGASKQWPSEGPLGAPTLTVRRVIGENGVSERAIRSLGNTSYGFTEGGGQLQIEFRDLPKTFKRAVFDIIVVFKIHDGPRITGTRRNLKGNNSSRSKKGLACWIHWSANDSCGNAYNPSTGYKVYLVNGTTRRITAKYRRDWSAGVDRGSDTNQVTFSEERRLLGCSKDDTHPYPRNNTYSVISCD